MKWPAAVHARHGTARGHTRSLSSHTHTECATAPTGVATRGGHGRRTLADAHPLTATLGLPDPPPCDRHRGGWRRVNGRSAARRPRGRPQRKPLTRHAPPPPRHPRRGTPSERGPNGAQSARAPLPQRLAAASACPGARRQCPGAFRGAASTRVSAAPDGPIWRLTPLAGRYILGRGHPCSLRSPPPTRLQAGVVAGRGGWAGSRRRRLRHQHPPAEGFDRRRLRAGLCATRWATAPPLPRRLFATWRAGMSGRPPETREPMRHGLGISA